jgi:hypothetical protein
MASLLPQRGLDTGNQYQQQQEPPYEGAAARDAVSRGCFY